MALKVKQIAHALKQSSGNVSAAARALGVDRSTIYRHIDDSPTLKQTLIDSREELVDIAESALKREVLDGNITAIIFTLKTLGKQRGYVERSQYEIGGSDGSAIEVKIVRGNDDPYISK